MKAQVGDFIYFKSDIEQWGRVVTVIPGSGGLNSYRIKPASGTFYGHYLHNASITEVREDDVFDVCPADQMGSLS